MLRTSSNCLSTNILPASFALLAQAPAPVDHPPVTAPRTALVMTTPSSRLLSHGLSRSTSAILRRWYRGSGDDSQLLPAPGLPPPGRSAFCRLGGACPRRYP